ncbi:MAG: OB-fold domain-containing protein [Microbacterium sp.]
MKETTPERVRPLPLLDDFNRAFWQGGAEGKLNIHRCRSCRRYFTPPSPVCRHCHSRDVGPEAVSGQGSVYSFTINHHRWLPNFPPPYVIALVELAEQEGLRVFSNIVDCDVTEVTIGMPVTVGFIEQEDVFVPVFRPATRLAGTTSSLPASAAPSRSKDSSV